MIPFVVGFALTLGAIYLAYFIQQRHRHDWSKWEVKEYQGIHSRLPNQTIMMREQERHCIDCGKTQVEDLP